jgi:hypothetical protein
VRGLAIAAVMVLLGVGAVWVGKHAPVPSNHPSAAQLARERKAELAYRALRKRIAVNARRSRALARARVRWARRANNICRSVVRTDRAALRRVERTTSLAEALDILGRAEVQGRSVMARLEALQPPPGRTARRVKRMLDLYDKAFALDQAAFVALRNGDRAGLVRILQREIPIGERGDAIARDLGATVCADGVFADSA